LIIPSRLIKFGRKEGGVDPSQYERIGLRFSPKLLHRGVYGDHQRRELVVTAVCLDGDLGE